MGLPAMQLSGCLAAARKLPRKVAQKRCPGKLLSQESCSKLLTVLQVVLLQISCSENSWLVSDWLMFQRHSKQRRRLRQQVHLRDKISVAGLGPQLLLPPWRPLHPVE